MLNGRTGGGLFPAQPGRCEAVAARHHLEGAVLLRHWTQKDPELQGLEKRIAVEILLKIGDAASSPCTVR